MTNHLDTLVEPKKRFTVEVQRANRDQGEDADRGMDVLDNPFDRRDSIVIVVSIVLLVLATWCFAPG